MNPRHIEDFARRLQGFLPGGAEGADALREEFRAGAKEALTALLAKMDLVTREEFEVQATLLERAYEKLDDLEARVREMEATNSQVD